MARRARVEGALGERRGRRLVGGERAEILERLRAAARARAQLAAHQRERRRQRGALGAVERRERLAIAAEVEQRLGADAQGLEPEQAVREETIALVELGARGGRIARGAQVGERAREQARLGGRLVACLLRRTRCRAGPRAAISAPRGATPPARAAAPRRRERARAGAARPRARAAVRAPRAPAPRAPAARTRSPGWCASARARSPPRRPARRGRTKRWYAARVAPAIMTTAIASASWKPEPRHTARRRAAHEHGRGLARRRELRGIGEGAAQPALPARRGPLAPDEPLRLGVVVLRVSRHDSPPTTRSAASRASRSRARCSQTRTVACGTPISVAIASDVISSSSNRTMASRWRAGRRSSIS